MGALVVSPVLACSSNSRKPALTDSSRSALSRPTTTYMMKLNTPRWQRTGRIFRLGAAVVVRVLEADTITGSTVFELVNGEAGAEVAGYKSTRGPFIPKDDFRKGKGPRKSSHRKDDRKKPPFKKDEPRGDGDKPDGSKKKKNYGPKKAKPQRTAPPSPRKPWDK